MAESIPQERPLRYYVRKGRKGYFLQQSFSSEEAKRQKGLCDALLEKKRPLAQEEEEEEEEKKKQKAPEDAEDWEKEYSYEEKMLKARCLDKQEYGEWEKKNRSWEIQNGLVPTIEEEEEEMRKKGLGHLLKPAKEKAPAEDWEKEYSYEEKMLKARLDGQGYGEWEKKNRLWEIQNGLVPIAEGDKEEEMRRSEIRFLLACLPGLDTKEAKEAFQKRIDQVLTKTEPKGDLVYRTVQLPPEEEARKKHPLTPEGLQYLLEKGQPTRVFSWDEERENLAAQAKAEGRCLDGSYLTPYCNCNKQCYRFDTALEDHPPECLPIWLAYCRQFRQSHCFDIDDYIGGRVAPLKPFQDFNGKAEILLELANHAIQDYNEKEYNVFKYKVLKIEKVIYSPANNMYWMTVKVLNLTLGTPIETFQIHAGTRYADTDKIIFCCRPKEEPIIPGLPSCEFCFGLLPERVMGGQEP